MRTLTMEEAAQVGGVGVTDSAMHATRGVLEREHPLAVKEPAKVAAPDQPADGPIPPLPPAHPCGSDHLCPFWQ